MEKEDWDMFYDIEDRLHSNDTDQEDVRKLLSLIRKNNGNLIEPRLHDKIQKVFNRL